MKVTLISFGFKYGVPKELTFLWDVRSLPNPHWVDELRPKTGLDQEISRYVLASEEGSRFLKLLQPLVLFLVEQNIVAGKKTMVMGVGCTGGRHRSVAIVEALGKTLKPLPVELQWLHRDIDKDARPGG